MYQCAFLPFPSSVLWRCLCYLQVFVSQHIWVRALHHSSRWGFSRLALQISGSVCKVASIVICQDLCDLRRGRSFEGSQQKGSIDTLPLYVQCCAPLLCVCVCVLFSDFFWGVGTSLRFAKWTRLLPHLWLPLNPFETTLIIDRVVSDEQAGGDAEVGPQSFKIILEESGTDKTCVAVTSSTGEDGR